MAKQVRFKTTYPGVFFIKSMVPGTKKPDRIYYIRYRRDGKLIEERAGRQSTNDMTPARASTKRTERLEGIEKSNAAKRAEEHSKWTINRLWESYKENKTLKGIVTDQNRFDLYISPHFGKKEPSEIIALDVHRIKVKALKTKSPATTKNILELLRRIINYGVKNNLCEGIKFTIEMPKLDNEKTEDLTPDQLASLLQAIENSSDIIAANMMKLALYTGMRRGEMFKLQWEHVDFDRGFISLVDPKGAKSQKIPLNNSARAIFTHLPRTSDYVFPGKGGGQRVDVTKAVNRIRDAAGLPKTFRALHGLRHVYATMLASSGQVDLYTLQKLMTHKSPVMTQRYAHLRDSALRKASNLAGDIINNALADKNEKVVNLKR